MYRVANIEQQEQRSLGLLPDQAIYTGKASEFVVKRVPRSVDWLSEHRGVRRRRPPGSGLVSCQG